MKSEIIKSRLDIVKYGIGITLSLMLILLNLIGASSNIYITFDNFANPTLTSLRNLGVNTNIFFAELSNKSDVLNENLRLRKEIISLEGLQVENENIKHALETLKNQSNLQIKNEKKFQLVKIRGLQNLYSSDPFVLLEIPSGLNVYAGDPVYYSKSHFFGFVSEVNGLTARVIPFYSNDMKFGIPVKNSKDSVQTGFISSIDNGQIKIKNVGKNASVSMGDIWVTTNDRSEVPGDFIIGKIKSISEDKETGFKELEIEAPFQLFELRYLFIERYD